mmetsp:Transcript_90256/g.255822  ORF Transcript_90256/g.255822 Transcript_90256/m.255822 type:complete len:345 (-) Transcript_90256:86-1120(-)
MWRLGHQAAAQARRRIVGWALLPVSCPPTRGIGSSGLLRFCAPASPEPPQRPTPQAKRRPRFAGAGKACAFTLAGGAAVYAANDDVRETVDATVEHMGELFEDFNDETREFFERIGDKIVSKRQEPWLLELATMQYPENVPTLVLDLDKVILHLEHDSRQGWHVIKRPFADQFFKEIVHYYEVVIFSDDVFPVALDIVTKWNIPVTGVLHRDFCKKKRNHYVKDLSKLGRKLDKVLMIDHDPAAFVLQPENGIVIHPFEGDPDDSELADLLEFLKAAATMPGDIRSFVAKFGGGDADVGRRYLLHKKDQDVRVEQRRSVGRVFAASRGFPPGPGPQARMQVGGF